MNCFLSLYLFHSPIIVYSMTVSDTLPVSFADQEVGSNAPRSLSFSQILLPSLTQRNFEGHNKIQYK